LTKKTLNNITDRKIFQYAEDKYKTNSNYKLNQSTIESFSKERIFIPGDEWIYIKLYGNSKRVEEFIGYHLLPFCEEMIDKKEVNKFFYIRYNDSESHIRLRLKLINKKSVASLMALINKWCSELIHEGLLTTVVFDTYVREVERYGGPQLIEIAEDVFYNDSLFVAKLISLKRSGKLTLDLESIAVASIVNMLEELGMDYNTQQSIFSCLYDKDENRELFKNKRSEYLKVANSFNNWQSLCTLKDGAILRDLFKIRKDSLNLLGTSISLEDDKGNLYNSKLNIILSTIHMFCNRLNGDLKFERRVMCLIRHSLHALQYFNKSTSTLK